MSWQSQQRFKQRKNKTNYRKPTAAEQYYPKNRVLCAECGRQKILFESESKANRYIEYNARHVVNKQGNQPTRAYYCESCGGWHVTHHPEPLNFDKTPTERLIEAYRSDLNATVASWNDVEFAAIFLDDDSKAKLLNVLSDCAGELPDADRMYCEHSTLYHNSSYNIDSKRAIKVMVNIDKEIEQTDNGFVRFSVDAIGIGEYAVAFRVVTQFPHTNAVQHITAYTFNGGCPADSNKITEWHRLPSRIKLAGTIRKIRRNNRNFLSYQNLTSSEL